MSAALAVVSLALGVMALRTKHDLDRSAQRFEAALLEVAPASHLGSVDDARPIVVSADFTIPQITWPILDDARWLRLRDDEPAVVRGEDRRVAALVHADGVSELYLGQIKGPRIDIATDAVVRPAGAKDYAAATRMYGLVDGHLLWAWDIAALGYELAAHASARLARVD